MGGGKVLHLSAGTYIVNSLALGGGSVIVVDSGPVIITPAAAGIAAGTCCAVDFSGGGIQNASGIPNNLQIIFGGQAQISLSGGAGDYGVIYAPNAPVSIGGGGDFYGAIVGKTVDNGGGTSVH